MEDSSKNNKSEKENDLYQNLKIFTQTIKEDELKNSKQIASLNNGNTQLQNLEQAIDTFDSNDIRQNFGINSSLTTNETFTEKRNLEDYETENLNFMKTKMNQLVPQKDMYEPDDYDDDDEEDDSSAKSNENVKSEEDDTQEDEEENPSDSDEEEDEKLYNNEKPFAKHIIDDIDGNSEDEGINDYKKGGYHPVYVGEVLVDRYVLIQKLGWGHFSTVWLSKDFKYNTYVAIKVQKSASHYLEAAYDEVELLQKAAKHSMDKKWVDRLSSHYKKENREDFTREDCHVVQQLNAFIYKGPYGNHFSMVFEIQGVNQLEIIKRYDYKGVPMPICRKIAKQILLGLDYLHNICNIIHTDLKPENVLLCLSKKEIDDIIENGQLSGTKKHEEKIMEYEKKYKFKNLKRVIAEFKQDYAKPLRDMQIEDDIAQSNKKKQFKEDDDAFTFDFKNRHYTDSEDEELYKPKKNEYKKVNKEEPKKDTLHLFEPKENGEFDVEEAYQKIIDNRDEPINKRDKKKLKKNLKRKLKRMQKREKDNKKKADGITVTAMNDDGDTESKDITAQVTPMKPNKNLEKEGAEINEAIQDNNTKKQNGLADNLADIEDAKNENVSKDRESDHDDPDNLKLPLDFKLKIADLGNACWTHRHFQPEIQTRQYRSPEVILGIKYNDTTDIWSFACMIFEMQTGDFQFAPRKGKDYSKSEDHLALMMESLHKFPTKYATVGSNWRKYFNKEGHLKKIKELKYFPIEEVLLKTYKFKLSEAREFAKFLRPMLIIYPEKRATAAHALQSRWLQKKSDSHLCTNDTEVDNEVKSFIESKSAFLYFRQQKNYATDQYFGDADGEFTDNTSDEDDHLGFQYKRPPTTANQERNFTNTYVGYDEGIDVEELDSTANWQFGKKKIVQKM